MKTPDCLCGHFEWCDKYRGIPEPKKMTNDTRINLQYDIIEFLKPIYSGNLTEEDGHDEARHDSYKIIEIIEKHLGKFERKNG